MTKEVRTLVHHRYAEYRAVWLATDRYAAEVRHALTIHHDRPLEVYIAALFVRTLASTRATIILLEHGLETQARVVLRAAIESLYAVVAIATDKDGTFLPELIETQDQSAKVKIAKSMSRWEGKALKEVAAQMDPARRQELASQKVKRIEPSQLAERAGLGDWHLTIYDRLSQAAHSHPADLEARHIRFDDDGEFVAINDAPEVENQAQTWEAATEVLSLALHGLGEVFPEAVDRGRVGGYLDAIRKAQAAREDVS